MCESTTTGVGISFAPRKADVLVPTGGDSLTTISMRDRRRWSRSYTRCRVCREALTSPRCTRDTHAVGSVAVSSPGIANNAPSDASSPQGRRRCSSCPHTSRDRRANTRVVSRYSRQRPRSARTPDVSQLPDALGHAAVRGENQVTLSKRQQTTHVRTTQRDLVITSLMKEHLGMYRVASRPQPIRVRHCVRLLRVILAQREQETPCSQVLSSTSHGSALALRFLPGPSRGGMCPVL